MVEVTGLEPAASCSQSKHSSQTELHLVICKTPKGVTAICKTSAEVLPYLANALTFYNKNPDLSIKIFNFLNICVKMEKAGCVVHSNCIVHLYHSLHIDRPGQAYGRIQFIFAVEGIVIIVYGMGF